MLDLSPTEALSLRMTALLLRPGAGPSGVPPRDVAGVVTWFGAMQAQDLASGLWSLGIRLPGMTQGDVEAAMERREALRTWPMRGTVHLVPSRDARWMLEVLGERPLARAASRRAVIGLDEAVADRAVTVLGDALAGGGRLTRSRCLQVLAETGISGTGQFGYHLLWYASQRGVTCIAPNVDGEQTFVLLDEWVPDPHRPGREEALAVIATRYVRSHGPVTRADLAGWTGLTVADTRRGLAAAGEAVVTIRVGGREMVVARDLLEGWSAGSPPADPGNAVLALPGFDEYLLGFKDRTLMLRPEHLAAVVPGGNGVFRATLVRDGRVIGTWKRSSSRARTVVEVIPLTRLGIQDRTRAERALQPYARFLGRSLEVRWTED